MKIEGRALIGEERKMAQLEIEKPTNFISWYFPGWEVIGWGKAVEFKGRKWSHVLRNPETGEVMMADGSEPQNVKLRENPLQLGKWVKRTAPAVRREDGEIDIIRDPDKNIIADTLLNHPTATLTRVGSLFGDGNMPPVVFLVDGETNPHHQEWLRVMKEGKQNDFGEWVLGSMTAIENEKYVYHLAAVTYWEEV